MKSKLIIIAFLFTKIFYSQIKISEDNLIIKYEKTKTASQNIGAVTNVRTKSKKIVQYNIKVRIEMLDNKKRPFDPNKFSLVNFQDSLRVRPIDVTFTNFTDKWHFMMLIKNKPKNKSLKKRYKPEIKDTFLDYEFEGITNLTIPIEFEADSFIKVFFIKPKRVAHETYFEPKSLRKRNINLYFPILKSVKRATLYYGKTKIKEIEFI